MKRKEIDGKYLRERKKDGPGYFGFDSWSLEEQAWAEGGKAQLNILRKNLKLTSKERKEIQDGVVEEVELAGKKQHP